MGKRANPMRIKAVLTYTPEEAAKALGKSTATIRKLGEGRLARYGIAQTHADFWRGSSRLYSGKEQGGKASIGAKRAYVSVLSGGMQANRYERVLDPTHVQDVPAKRHLRTLRSDCNADHSNA